MPVNLLPFARVVFHYLERGGKPSGVVAFCLACLHAPMGDGPRPQVFLMACAPLDVPVKCFATSTTGLAVGSASQVFSPGRLGVNEFGAQPCFP